MAGNAPIWLDRALIVGPYLTLCTTERQLRQALRKMCYCGEVPSFLKTDQANSTMHWFERESGLCSAEQSRILAPPVVLTLIA